MADTPARRQGKGALFSGAPVDLDGRDPEFIRSQLPLWWLIATLYHRAEVNGFEKVPDGPVLFVGNHSGGSVPIDTTIFMLAHNTFFSVDRPLYALGHVMVTSLPVLGTFARKIGVVTAGMESANQAFARGASVLVYPGGDVEVMRPWKERHRVDFDGRKGFLRLAHQAGVPIVPVTACGGHDTLVVLNDGKKLAKLLRFDKLGRVKSVPIALAAPWGVTLGDWFGHIPFPAKITIEVGDPIDIEERFGEDPDWDEAYDYVTSTMQVTLSNLASQRLMPPFR